MEQIIVILIQVIVIPPVRRAVQTTVFHALPRPVIQQMAAIGSMVIARRHRRRHVAKTPAPPVLGQMNVEQKPAAITVLAFVKTQRAVEQIARRVQTRTRASMA